MTISLAQNAARVSYSVSEGATQTSFTVSFEFFDDADLNVYVDGTKKTLTTHYTVSGGSGSTGAVAISVTGATGGSTVVITRDIALARTTDFPTSGSFQIATLNTELDRFTAIAADLKDSVDRGLILSDSDSSVSTTLPLLASRKGTVLGFNASTGAVEAGPSITAVQSLADVTTAINLLGTSDAVSDMNTLGTSTNVINQNTLAGISSNITTVAGIASDVTAVAGDATDIGVVAGKATEIGRLGTSDAVANMALLGTSAVVADMALLGTSAVVEDMGLLATSAVIEDMGLLATSAVIEDMGLLATSAVIEDIGLLATSSVISDMSTLAGSGANPNITSLTASGAVTAGSLDVTGVATAATFEPDGDTAAGDNAAIGYTAAEGLILTGQGSTSDITLKNDADATVFTVPTGTDDILFPDNAKILMGAGSDLQIYHDGSDSYVDDAGTGALILRGNSNVTMRIDSSGAVTKPLQPAFLAQVASAQTDLANYVNVVIFGTEIFDQNADFNPSNGIFTAPVTGKYMLSTFIGLDQIPATGTGVLQLQIVASNRTVYAAFDPIVFDATSTKYTFTQSLLLDMDASDTAKIQIYMPVSSSTVDINTQSFFSGYLVA